MSIIPAGKKELESVYHFRNTNAAKIAQMHDWYRSIKPLVKPGALIDKETLENLFGCPFEQNSWQFRGAVIALRQRIKAAGFFTEDRKCKPPEFRIVASEDMAKFAKKRMYKNLVSNYEVAYVMAAHDKSGLTEDQKKEHEKMQLRAANSAIWQQRTLLGNSIF